MLTAAPVVLDDWNLSQYPQQQGGRCGGVSVMGWLSTSAGMKGKSHIGTKCLLSIAVSFPALSAPLYSDDGFRWAWLNALKGVRLVIPFPTSPSPSPPKTSTTGLLQKLMSDCEISIIK